MTDEYLLDAVLNTVLDVTKQKRNNVLSVKRIREICVYPRQIVFFVMSKGYEWSLYRISKTFNDIGFPMIMNHATIIHNVKTLTNYMETDRYVNRTVKEVFESLNLKLN